MRSLTFEMIGMTLMALMVLLVVGGGTTCAYLMGQGGARRRVAVPTRGQASWHRSRPSVSDRLEDSATSGGEGPHGHRDYFLGP